MAKFSDFNLSLNIEKIMMLMECPKHHNLYNEMIDELEEIRETIEKSVEPVAFLTFGEIPNDKETYPKFAGKKALYSIISVGKKLSDLSTKCFQEGDYVKGMLFDRTADAYLFDLDALLTEKIRSLCIEEKYGVSHRLEAPQDISMEINKVAYTLSDAENEADMGITSGLMLSPVKSGVNIYILDENNSELLLEHNCDSCPLINCKMRNTKTCKITAVTPEREVTFDLIKGKSLLDGLRENNIMITAPCGGAGKCGKCAVTVSWGDLPPSKEDERFFSSEEILQGKRLSCCSYPKNNCIVKVNFADEEMTILIENTSEISNGISSFSGRAKIAIDIGTTTIAMQLIDAKTNTCIDTFSAVNRQRTYGADVISRIKSANEGNAHELKKLIADDLTKGINALISNKKIDVEKIVIVANTTMIHLLMGFSCKTLGEMPFKSDHTDTIFTNTKTLFSDVNIECEVVILPSICAFVGADITAGMIACKMYETQKVSVLIDLGTNGEVAIGNSEKILVSSTAAGPAFEAGNITHGTASISGAISGIRLKNKEVDELTTINNANPVGICGTGAIEILSELLKAEIVDETGLLDDDYFDDGFQITDEIVFTQKDIREIQLAKSAIRAGIETLIKSYGVSYDDIENVYLAGGLGHALSIQSATTIGIFPDELKSKIKTIGNSALAGAVNCVCDEKMLEKANIIKEKAIEVDLSTNPDFNAGFMNYISFETDLLAKI